MSAAGGAALELATSREAAGQVTDAPATPTLLDLDLGFLALPRRLWGSEWFRSLPPLEKLAVVDALMCGRYADGGEFYFAGERVPLAIGQFIDSAEERARRLGLSRKVIRTTDRKMAAAGLLSRARVHPAGRCPFVTTVLNYERIRLTREVTGQRTDPRVGQQGANSGPVEGQQGAPSEQRVTKGTKEPGRDLFAAPAAPARRRAKAGTADPRHAQFIAEAADVFKAKRPGARFDCDGHDGKKLREFLSRHPEATADEWRAVYGRALELGKWPGTAKVAQALDRWNDLAPTPANGPRNGAPVAAPPASAFTGGAGGFGS